MKIKLRNPPVARKEGLLPLLVLFKSLGVPLLSSQLCFESFLGREAGESQLSEPTLVLAASAAPPGVTDPCPVRRSSVLYFTLLGSDSGAEVGHLPASLFPAGQPSLLDPFPTVTPPLASLLDPFSDHEPQVVLTETLRRPLECTISPSSGTDEANRSGTLLLSK